MELNFIRDKKIIVIIVVNYMARLVIIIIIVNMAGNYSNSYNELRMGYFIFNSTFISLGRDSAVKLGIITNFTLSISNIACLAPCYFDYTLAY